MRKSYAPIFLDKQSIISLEPVCVSFIMNHCGEHRDSLCLQSLSFQQKAPLCSQTTTTKTGPDLIIGLLTSNFVSNFPCPSGAWDVQEFGSPRPRLLISCL